MLESAAGRAGASIRETAKLLRTAPRLLPGRHVPRSRSAKPPSKDTQSRSAGVPQILKAVTAAVGRKKRRYQKRHLLEGELVLDRPGTFLGKRSRRLVIRHGRQTLREAPAFRLRNVLISGRGVSLSSDALWLCAAHQIPVSLVDFTGKPVGRFVAPELESAECGLAQLQALHSGRWLSLAKSFVRGKIKNQWNLVKYLHKYHKSENEDFARAFREEGPRIEAYLTELRRIECEKGDGELTRGRLFAVEGRGAAAYWRLLSALLDPEVGFPGRRRRNAGDLVNNLLNYGYGILYNQVWAAVLLAGLSPNIGFLHVGRSKRPALVFDLVEEFRAQTVDRVVMALLNRDERLHLTGSRLSTRTRDRMLAAVLERLASPTRYRSQSVPLGKAIRLQARGLAKALIEGKRYRPFLAKW